MIKMMENAMVAAPTPPSLRAPKMFIVVAAVMKTKASNAFAFAFNTLKPHPSYNLMD
jgi:hypothetical protein